MLLLHRKQASHEAKILQALKKSGHYGMWNHELAKQGCGGLSWHQRITDLRKDGHNISRVQISRGNHKYFLED